MTSGFTITEQPAANAVEIFLDAKIIGKFHGTRAATTPTGPPARPTIAPIVPAIIPIPALFAVVTGALQLPPLLPQRLGAAPERRLADGRPQRRADAGLRPAPAGPQ